jgi:hypothetical protein
MTYEPRSVSFLARDGRLKHYGIAFEGDAPRPELAAATRRIAEEVIPDGAYGFTIAQDAKSAGLGLVYWSAEENEVHERRAWLQDVLGGGDLERYLEPVAL